jgi:hypothetical protein
VLNFLGIRLLGISRRLCSLRFLTVSIFSSGESDTPVFVETEAPVMGEVLGELNMLKQRASNCSFTNIVSF